MNWDPNDGISESDDVYAARWHVTPQEAAVLGFLRPMSKAQVVSYWWVLCGQDKARRGDGKGAVADYRQACQTAPDRLMAQNELAWALATNPDAAVRNGREALKIAESLVAKLRRVNWLETLAASHAEVGNFPQAEAVESEARRIVAATSKGAAAMPWFESCIAAYSHGISYARAVETGLIKVPATQGMLESATR